MLVYPGSMFFLGIPSSVKSQASPTAHKDVLKRDFLRIAGVSIDNSCVTLEGFGGFES